MRTSPVATAALASSLVMMATTALAQNVSTQGSNAGVNTGSSGQQRSGNTGPNTGSFGQDQQQVTLPSAFTFTTRRAGMGPGGFTQLCDDPLDPRLSTNECSAAGIGQ